MQIGKTREEPSRARVIVRASSAKLLSEILHGIQPHGASVESERDCRLSATPADGIFPDEFYATTHLPTQVRMQDQWVEVEGIEMDLGILVDLVGLTARTIPMGQVKRGDQIVTGREGVRVIPLQRPRARDVFSFMESQVSSERPHGHVISDIAKRLVQLRIGFREGKASKVLLAGGPAIVHAGGREALAWLIDEAFVHVLFCGNALPA